MDALPPPDALRAKLQGEVLDAPWDEFAPHLARQAVLLVAPDVDLLDVAVAMARDDAPRLQRWLESGEVARPTPEWGESLADATPRLQAVIVQPWVLAQVIPPPTKTTPTAEA